MKCNTGTMTLSGKTKSFTSSTAEPIGLLQSLSSSVVVTSKIKNISIISGIDYILPVFWKGEDVPHINVIIDRCIHINGPPDVNITSSPFPFQFFLPFFLNTNQLELSIIASPTMRR